MFRVSPPEMVFQNFTTHEVYDMFVSLVNNDKVSAGMWSFNTVLGEWCNSHSGQQSKVSAAAHPEENVSAPLFCKMVEIFLCWEFSPDFAHGLMVPIPKEFPSHESSGLIGMLRAVQFLPALMLCLESIPHPCLIG